MEDPQRSNINFEFDLNLSITAYNSDETEVSESTPPIYYRQFKSI